MNESKSHELTEEEKKAVLDDTKKYTDELEELEKLHDSFTNNIENAVDESGEELSEEYDIEKNRQNGKEKKETREINRKVGYHRRYLHSNVKLSNIILIIVFIILSCMVIVKYTAPEKTSTSEPSIVASSDTMFGVKISIKTESKYDEKLYVKVTLKNNENSIIQFNPEAIMLMNGKTIYTPSVSAKDKRAVPVKGIQPGEVVTFNLTYNIDEESVANSSLEMIVVGNDEVCVFVTSLGLYNER